MSVIAKAIPTGTPTTAVGRVPTPPVVGPLGGSHWWSARSLRGGASTVTTVPDMLGSVDLVQSGSGAWSFVDGQAPKITSTGGYWLQGSTTADNATDRTVLFVGMLHTANRQQLQIPGYSPIGVANGSSLYVAGATLNTGTLPTSPAVFVFVFSSSASTVKVSINGGAWASAALPSLGATTTYRLGAQTTSTNTDVYMHLETWQRALNNTEAAQANTDARALYSI